MKSLIVTVAVLMLFVNIQSPAKTRKKNSEMPIWVESPYKEYSRDKYFAVTESDQNKNFAEYKAVESLASIFGQDVLSENKVISSITQNQTADEIEVFKSDSLNQQILINIDQKNLIGIEIARTWFDEIHEEWYALSVLDKEKTADLYSSFVEDNVKAMNVLLKNASAISVPSIQKLAYIYKAGQFSLLNESYYPRFYIIHPEKCNSAKLKNIPYENIQVELDKVSAKIPVAIEVSGITDGTEETVSACAALLKSYGLTVTQNNSVYTFLLSITTEYRSVENPVMYYCEFTMSAYLKDSSGEKYVPWTVSGRSGAKTKELASQKAVRIMVDKISSDYKTVFDKYFIGEKQ